MVLLLYQKTHTFGLYTRTGYRFKIRISLNAFSSSTVHILEVNISSSTRKNTLCFLYSFSLHLNDQLLGIYLGQHRYEIVPCEGRFEFSALNSSFSDLLKFWCAGIHGYDVIHATQGSRFTFLSTAHKILLFRYCFYDNKRFEVKLVFRLPCPLLTLS